MHDFAHTCFSGRAVPQNSGFRGQDGWVPNRNRLDNQFYRVLLQNGQADPSFEQEFQVNNNNPFPNQFMWREQGDDEFMLNADMALAIDLDGLIVDGTGEALCRLEGQNGNEPLCPPSELLQIAQEFAGSNDAWLAAFHDAFITMTNTGCDSSTCTAV